MQTHPNEIQQYSERPQITPQRMFDGLNWLADWLISKEIEEQSTNEKASSLALRAGELASNETEDIINVGGTSKPSNQS